MDRRIPEVVLIAPDEENRVYVVTLTDESVWDIPFDWVFDYCVKHHGQHQQPCWECAGLLAQQEWMISAAVTAVRAMVHWD